MSTATAMKNGQLSPKSMNDSALTGAGDSDVAKVNDEKSNESLQNNNKDNVKEVNNSDEKINSSDVIDDENINDNDDVDHSKKKIVNEKSKCNNDINNINELNDIESNTNSVEASVNENGDISSMNEDAAAASANIDSLLEGLNEKVANKLKEIFISQKLTINDLDERAIEALKDFGNIDGVLSVLNEFDESSLEHVSNKSAFLCGIMKAYRQKEKANKSTQQQQQQLLAGNSSVSINGTINISNSGNNEASASSSTSSTTIEQNHNPSYNQNNTHPGPDEAKLKAILDRTGYTLDVTSGQRKYGGPPPDWDGPMPSAGSEIFVGKIPKEIFEDELIPLFEKSGKIWDLRLMIDPVTGYNRGYCFITYCNKAEAYEAQQRFDSFEIRKGKSLKVNISVPNLRLFVGNIPKSKTKEEIYQEFSKLTTGLLEVIVYSSPDDRKRNRGFCFLEFESHKSASLAKRKLSSGRTKIWGCDILVDWADPQEEPDQETMSKVKVLYARNLTSKITEEQLREVFEKYGGVERVKKIKDYAFIHFIDRDNAIKAMSDLHGKELNGVKIDISLAKPPSDRKKKEEILRNRERRVMVMMQQRALVIGAPRGPVFSVQQCFGNFATQAQPAPPPIAFQPPVMNTRNVRSRPIPAAAALPSASILTQSTFGHRPVPRSFYHVPLPTTAAAAATPLLNTGRVRQRSAGATATLPANILSPYAHRPVLRDYSYHVPMN